MIKEFGPDHNKKFEAAVYVKGKFLGKGAGNSKKEAQQFAAEQAMENIKTERKLENLNMGINSRNGLLNE
jgi:ribonuclease-3